VVDKFSHLLHNCSTFPAVMFELETLLAFSLGAGLVSLAPLVRKLGNQQLGDSMNQAGRTMAKGGIKLGVTVAGVAGTAARSVARHAAEAAESIGDLVAEARTELDAETEANAAEVEPTAKATSGKGPRSKGTSATKEITVTEVTVE
jgi:hypothetical protein